MLGGLGRLEKRHAQLSARMHLDRRGGEQVYALLGRHHPRQRRADQLGREGLAHKLVAKLGKA